jgi:Amt family ammonium transporter
VSFILDEIAAHGIAPSTLCFEITETSAISHLGNARELSLQLKAAGCSLALDDFGSGLSSFSYLKELPVDFLKIDGNFVRNIGQDPTDRAIVSSIVQVARATGKKTIAEYVENESCLYWVRTLDVDYAQGYCIGRPRPLQALLDTGNAIQQTNAGNGPNKTPVFLHPHAALPDPESCLMTGSVHRHLSA